MKAEVKINELRVGNFVYGLDEYQGTALPIYSLHGDNTLRLLVGNESIGCFRVGLINPIEITDEWLEMFGFEKKHKVYDYFKLNELITLTKTNANEQEQGYDVRFKNTYICRVNKVHVLQNIHYYLNNFEELTIKTKL